MAKFTPGPWTWEPCQTDAGTRYQHVMATKGMVNPAAGTGICDTYHHDPIGIGTATEDPDPNNDDHWVSARHGNPADARLITAAPEMFELLERLTDHPDPDDYNQIIDDAHELLFRIEGE